MAVLAYGLNFRTASLEIRERVAFASENLGAALTGVREAIPSLTEATIISTCNRTELYCALAPEDELQVPAWLADNRQLSADLLRNSSYSYWDQDAARHFMRVAAGLDSQVLGEPQILGQVKSAVEFSRQQGLLGPELQLLSDITLRTAKRVRSDTDIGRNPISVAFAAVNLAKQIFSHLSEKKALLLGAGETIARVAEHLRQSGVQEISIANRTLAHAQTLAERYGGQAMQLTDVADKLHQFDILICSTGATLPVLGKGAVEAAIKRRRRRPIFMVDIAVPRDVEPAVGQLEDVYLYTIDDLSEIIEQNVKNRRLAAVDAEQLIDEGTQTYLQERRTLDCQHVLRQLRTDTDTMANAELARALKALRRGDGAEQVLEQLTRSLSNKLIHAPSAGLRKASADGRSDLIGLIKQLYGLD